jgi:hypothetical protein
MIIFDAHLDLAWNALDWNRNLLRPVEEIRRREREQKWVDKARGGNTVSFPELRRGKVAVFIATLLARSLQPNCVPAFQRYNSMEAAYAAARGQLAYYRALQRQGILAWIKNERDLDSHVRAWLEYEGAERGALGAEPPLGFILSMEGADPVLSPDQVEEWWDAGLRIIGPADQPILVRAGIPLPGGLRTVRIVELFSFTTTGSTPAQSAVRLRQLLHHAQPITRRLIRPSMRSVAGSGIGSGVAR